MRANLLLIQALENVAQTLKQNPEIYSWSNPLQCNCGLLAQEVIRLRNPNQTKAESALELSNLYYATTDRIHSWHWLAQQNICPNTGLPLAKLFKILHLAGIEKADFYRLEFLADIDFPNIDPYTYDQPQTVAQYFQAVAAQLKTKLQQQKLNQVKQTQSDICRQTNSLSKL